ncbi:MAG TPA: DNA adenine methylase [Acidimicrobiales bacterium]|nr:DNA adenine methylase [Acidimicrobiales bacterium]
MGEAFRHAPPALTRRAVIKYLGSKRRLVPVLAELLERARARTALDLFTGTTRVAQAFKAAGAEVTAVDTTRCATVLAGCYVATDADAVDRPALEKAVAALNRLPGRAGYVTETFCVRSRFFQPHNGERIDAVRQAIDSEYRGSDLEPVLLTSLMEAADRVDSTTGVQMAYVKQWAPRSFRPLELRVPDLLVGPGHAVRGDACAVVAGLGPFDLAYLDPPYNQHRYEANYHIWETLMAWDAPSHYGVACKRTEIRDGPRSSFNSRRTISGSLAQVVRDVQADLVVLSYNDESWIGLDALIEMCLVRGHVEVLAFPSNRYVGARIGIHNPAGERVGTVGRLRNVEYVLVAGGRTPVRRLVAPWRDLSVSAAAAS